MTDSGSHADDVRWLQRLDSFKRARVQLQSAVELSQQRNLSELEQQGLIQAFEFTHELAWNVMKDYLRSLGNSTVIASRDTTRAAFAAELIADGESWMDMIVSRNLSSHTYNRDTANALVQKITTSYAALFTALEQKMISIAHGHKHDSSH
jgi:nucleotidyltransferase substrate binding protein (TIGR01987 family)